MLAQLPRTLDELLTPHGRALLEHPSGGVAAGAAQIAATCRRNLPERIDLMYAPGDEQAVEANTLWCAERLRAHGTAVEVTELPVTPVQGSVHLGTNVTGTLAALRRLSAAQR